MMKYSDERRSLIEPFIRYRKASDRWNEGDAKNLMYFDKFCGELSPNAPGITQEMVDGWCALRPTESAGSRRRRTSIIIQFVRYLIQRGHGDISEPKIPVPKSEPKYVPHAFTNDELTRFFAECDRRAIQAKGKPNEARALIPPALFRLLYSSGCRTCEIRLLQCDHIDLNAGVINVEYTKGREQHYVALHQTTTDMLIKYDSVMKSFFPDRIFFFPANAESPLYQVWIPQTFRSIWDSVNESHSAVAYDLRHNYATANINRWVGENVDFSDKFMILSKSMGHTKLESTKYYYSIVPGLADVLDNKTAAGFDSIIPEVDYE